MLLENPSTRSLPVTAQLVASNKVVSVYSVANILPRIFGSESVCKIMAELTQTTPDPYFKVKKIEGKATTITRKSC
jgi:hypothetical protein